MARTKITLTCPECNIEFEKDKSEYTRNERLGRISYCSRSCGTKARNKNPETKAKLLENATSEENIKRLKALQGNRRDEFTPFRNLLVCTKRRKQHNNDLDLKYLKELWEIQKGLCAYTNIPLQLPEYSDSHLIHPTMRASIDRIDSNIGYIKGNVQYVSTPINYMKSTMSHEETVDFINKIINTLSLDKE